MRNLLTVADLKSAEIDRIFAITEDLKTKYSQGLREALLPGRVMALLFEKPSLRTRVSFEAGMINLGGSSLFLGDDVGFGARESVADFGRVLCQYVDVVVIRAFQHQTVLDLARYCSCAVINGLTDYAHPCQALADLYTLKELVGRLKGHTLAYVGDGNNVARSLAEGCGRMGMNFVMATPAEYQFDKQFLAHLKQEAPDLNLQVTTDPQEAVRRATAIYTDVWTSMGQEQESAKRRKDFSSYQINARLVAAAPAGAYFMHCLPAHRGEEVTDEVIDGPQSIVMQQAANRLHVQKGILAWILARKASRGGSSDVSPCSTLVCSPSVQCLAIDTGAIQDLSPAETTMMRHDGRADNVLRPITIQRHYTRVAAGSVLIASGRTTVLCTASIEPSVPPWMAGQGRGWVTAEYGMLPGSTSPRKRRDVGKVDGRTTEIQRLIGRSLRAVVDLEALGERSIFLDCDVLEADGGTRTASITGAMLALVDALAAVGELPKYPLRDSVAATSVGIVDGRPVLDLDYIEDVKAEVDMNVVMTGGGRYIEVQGTGEEATFSEEDLAKLLALARGGMTQIREIQRQALGDAWPF